MPAPVIIQCSRCGAPNRCENSRCAVCYAPLDESNLSGEESAAEQTFCRRQKIWLFFSLVAIASLTMIGVLIFWPKPIVAEHTIPSMRERVKRKIHLLRHAPDIAQTFTEAEITAYLMTEIEDSGPADTSWIPRLMTAKASVKPNAVIINYFAKLGPLPLRDWLLGPFDLTGSLTYVIDAHGKIYLHSAWLGHLYLPGSSARLVLWPVQSLKPVFSLQGMAPGNELQFKIEGNLLRVQALSRILHLKNVKPG